MEVIEVIHKAHTQYYNLRLGIHMQSYIEYIVLGILADTINLMYVHYQCQGHVLTDVKDISFMIYNTSSQYINISTKT